MSITGGPKAPVSGLVFYYDIYNQRSLAGEPTTNLIGSWGGAGNETKHTYPSAGNSWGSYHVELYNANTYFDIGPIAAVNSNIVSSSNAHPFRSYSVVRANATGGGITAGTNYFIKKQSATAFSVHNYISTENLGFGAHINVLNDTRVTVTASGFPTGWWGPPHLPNSTHVKEIVSNCYNGHDCVRIHHFRRGDINPASGSDQHGMAYGVTPTLTSGSTYTFSFYYRAVSQNALGKQINWQRYTSPTDNYSTNIPAMTYDWQRYTHTMTATSTGTTYQYWLFGGDSAMSSNFVFDVSELQIESKSNATRFTPYSRTSASALLDISGTNAIITASGYPFDSASNLSFDPVAVGTNDYLDFTYNSLINGSAYFTVNIWLNVTTVGNEQMVFSTVDDTHSTGWHFEIYTSKLYLQGYPAGTAAASTTLLQGGVPQNACITYNSGSALFYINGVDAGSAGAMTFTPSTVPVRIGGWRFNASYPFIGKIYSVRFYNRVLTPTEVLQSFTSMRSRYGV